MRDFLWGVYLDYLGKRRDRLFRAARHAEWRTSKAVARYKGKNWQYK